MNNGLRVAFFGRGDLGLSVLKRLLLTEQISVCLIITCDPSPDVPLSRDLFREVAAKHDIMYLESNDINSPQVCKLISDLSIDLAVAMLWLYKIKARVIDSIKHGILNLHGGLLPRYRGNACQAWAILSGERELGVTCHLMKPSELDSGPVIRQKSFLIREDAKVGDLISEVSRIGADLVIDSVMQFVNGDFKSIPQNDSLSLECYPRLPRDGEINWCMDSKSILRLIRAAGAPYSGAYSFYRGKLDGLLHKLVVVDARIENYPKGDYLAVPGHIIRFTITNECAVVCGDKRLIVLERIEIDGEEVLAIEAIRSVRQRLGLDISSEINSLWKLMAKSSKKLSDC
jgi:methionyl-tRNA formyltransferase